jgi:hypothetical protein
MDERLIILIFAFGINIWTGYYVHMMWRKPEDYRIKVRGWGYSNPLIPQSIAYSRSYLWLNKGSHIAGFLATSVFISILMLDLLRII